MFKEEYIIELLSGNLTEKGYSNIVGTIALMVRKYQWQKNIVVSENVGVDWTIDDIQELSQQFFLWIIENDKLKYLDKIPYDYISYYFTQMFISFVSDRIKTEQQKIGVSFNKCEELVREICVEDYDEIKIGNKTYVSSKGTSPNIQIDNLDDILKYMPKYVIKPTTKHFKPLVKMAIDDVMTTADGFVQIETLVKSVYLLLDQSSLFEDIYARVDNKEQTDDYTPYVMKILEGINKTDASIFLDYIFGDSAKMSLFDLAQKYNLPKSSIHNKISNFKKKIFSSYMPTDENDGIYFLKILANSLDEIVKQKY